MASDTMTNAFTAVVAGVVLVSVFVFLFVFPGHDPEPNHLPIGLVGPGEAARGISAGLEREYEVKRYAGVGEAREAILDRDVYGALIVGGNARALVASAASPQVALILEAVAAEGTVGPAPPAIEELRALDDDDPRGTTINLTVLPLAIT